MAEVATGEILAAGAVLWRARADGIETALVHRPRYDDWSFPKGKSLPGEHVLLTAVREVDEETGVRVALGRRLGSQSYLADGQPTVGDGPAERHRVVQYRQHRAPGPVRPAQVHRDGERLPVAAEVLPELGYGGLQQDGRRRARQRRGRGRSARQRPVGDAGHPCIGTGHGNLAHGRSQAAPYKFCHGSHCARRVRQNQPLSPRPPAPTRPPLRARLPRPSRSAGRVPD